MSLLFIYVFIDDLSSFSPPQILVYYRYVYRLFAVWYMAIWFCFFLFSKLQNQINPVSNGEMVSKQDLSIYGSSNYKFFLFVGYF